MDKDQEIPIIGPANPPINLTPPETDRVVRMLQACDRALTSCQKEHEADQAVIDKQNTLLTKQAADIVQLKDNDQSILRNPILWFAIGAVTGGAIMRLSK